LLNNVARRQQAPQRAMERAGLFLFSGLGAGSVENGWAADLFLYFQSLALVGFKIADDDTWF
jgi:hypothetical protein